MAYLWGESLPKKYWFRKRKQKAKGPPGWYAAEHWFTLTGWRSLLDEGTGSISALTGSMPRTGLVTCTVIDLLAASETRGILLIFLWWEIWSTLVHSLECFLPDWSYSRQEPKRVSGLWFRKQNERTPDLIILKDRHCKTPKSNPRSLLFDLAVFAHSSTRLCICRSVYKQRNWSVHGI